MMSCECKEPSLSEMMREPIIRAVMARDDVHEDDLRHLMDRVRDAFENRDDLTSRY